MLKKSVLTPYPKKTTKPEQTSEVAVSAAPAPAPTHVLSPVLSTETTLPASQIKHVAMDDVGYLRNSIFDKVKNAVIDRFPIENVRYKIELSNVKYDTKKDPTKKAQKEALLSQTSVNRRLKGRWRMTDKETGAKVDEQDMVLAHVPYLTERGTFIKNGNEYGVANQSRLKAGAYNRRRANMEAETHFNILEGGRGFHVVMNPETKKFTVQVGGAKLKLFPMLRDMGISDKQLRGVWGKEVYEDNIAADDSAKRARKQFDRFGEDGTSLTDIFAKMKLDPEVTLNTLGKPYANITPEVLLASTRRLIAISKGEEDEDDRDSIAYQKIMSPDDLFSERIALDYDKQTRQMLWNSTHKNKLAINSGHFTKQIDTIFTKSGLAQALEETNLIENLDGMFKVVRTGEAGISSDGVPMESRNVQGSHLGVIDPIRGPESGNVGLDSRFSINARRGNDGRMYSMMYDATGEQVPVSAQNAANSVIAFPGERESNSKKVRAMSKGGKIKYVDRKKVDYWLGDSSHMFSVGSNLVPMISSTLGPRLLMGGKFYNQALPLENPEAPLVQSMTDDGETSFEDRYGEKAGALHAASGGSVTKVTEDEIHIRKPGGKVEKIELYNSFPLNRKTFVSNTPQVKVGDRVAKGDLLASSNMTDKKGTLALGKNLTVAYMPWKGTNTDDAIVISASAAKQMASEHMFTKKIDSETHTQRDRKSYIGTYPAAYKKEQLIGIGDDGVIRPGMVVQKGDPLILAVKQRPISDIHRGHKPGFMDAAEEWDHESPGFVTDVVQTKKGVRISVKAYQPMQAGDKMVGRFGDKGIISEVVNDGEMPHDEEGNPIGVLLSPMTVVTRCYDDETEFLTPDGWKLGECVLDSDKVMCFDPEHDAIAFSEQLAPFHSAYYEGTMCEYESTTLSFCVTPNHTFWAQPTPGGPFTSVTAANMAARTRHKIPARASHVYEDLWLSDFALPELPVREKDNSSVRGPVTYAAKDFASLLGYYLAEGNTTYQDIHDSSRRVEYKVHIAQSDTANPGIVADIHELLTRMDISYHYSPRNMQFHITGKRMAHYFKQFGKSDAKCIPEWVFTQPRDVRQALIDAMWAGDGSVTKHSHGPVSHRYSTVSKQLADDLQRLLLLQGATSRRIVAISKKGHKPLWTVRLIHSDKKLRNIVKKNWSMKYYSGNIYCATTPTGYLVTRRNGTILLAGNTNPSQLVEAVLGKIADKTGKSYKLPGFSKGSMVEFASNELKKHGLSDTETLSDPGSKRKFKDIMTGKRFFMKLHHMGEDKEASRGVGGYTAEDQPVRGGSAGGGAKQMGNLGINALLSHGATEVVKDAKTIRGQKNNDFWKAFQQGYAPPSPEIPMIYKKFRAHLIGAGINVKKAGHQDNIMALTDKDVLDMSSGVITLPKGVDIDDMKEIEGGLFDKRITGGHNGCFHPSVQVWTDAGMLPIGEIVRNRMKVMVHSYDFTTREFVLKPVTEWFENQTDELGHSTFSSTGRVSTRVPRHSPTSLWGTPKHQVFDEHGTKHDLDAAPYLLAATEKPSYAQSQVLLGSLLGDGHVAPAGSLSVTHGPAQREYCEWKSDIFSAFRTANSTRFLESFGTLREKVTFRTCSHAVFHAARRKWYIAGTKLVPSDIESELDALALAVWYMDDGSVGHNAYRTKQSVILCTHGFSRQCVDRLAEALASKWGFRTSVNRREKNYEGKDYGWSLHLSPNSSKDFLDIVAPFIHPTMIGKLGLRPLPGSCSCGAAITRKQELCTECLLDRARVAGSHKIPKEVRRRLGTSKAIRLMLAGELKVPAQLTGCERWDARNAKACSDYQAVSQDTCVSLELQKVEHEYTTGTGARWENTKTVYDIGVADTHNYFANGILVSNSKWSRIKLNEPMPNPVMEEPVRRLLGLTANQFSDVLAGRKPLYDRTGGSAILEGLKRVDLKALRRTQEELIRSGAKSKRDNAIKLLRYIDGIEKMGMAPTEMMMNNVPVLPPSFRPISSTDKFTIVADANKLYVDLMKANESLDEVKKEFGDSGAGEERLNLYNSFKAVTGLGDPISPKLKQQQVRGLLGHVFGAGSPKYGMFQRRVLGGSVDFSGRAVITPNSSLDMDTVGLPEDQAWTLYKPMIMRRMTRRGMAPTIAAKNILERTKTAELALVEEMADRPVIINRAPTLHKYNTMAVFPQIIKGHTLQVSPIISSGFNADFDGDTMQLHVPVSKKAVDEAKEKMLPSANLLSASRFKAHYLPSQEFQHGLWLASTKQSKREEEVFATIEDAMSAYKNGELNIDDKIRIAGIPVKNRKE